MPGIYTRDQFAQQLANAIESAQARRQAHVDREAARTTSNMQAIGDFAKALGRTWETWDGKSDEEKLAALQKEREEAVKAQQEHEQELRDERASSMLPSNAGGPSLSTINSEAMRGYVPTPSSRYSEAMRGYVPMEVSMYAARPAYSDILKRGGLY